MSPGRQRRTLIATCFSQFMILLDLTIVNVALPSIQHELEVTPATLVWTINAYVLPLASFILVAGTLGDRYGRKRVFALGFVLWSAPALVPACSTPPVRSGRRWAWRRSGRSRRPSPAGRSREPTASCPACA